MTKNTPSINKINDKLAKVGDTFTVTMVDNGFLFDISGRRPNDDWASVRLICTDLDSLVTLIMEAVDSDKE